MPKKEINLLPSEEFEKKPLGKFLTWALTVGRWIVIFTELIVILAFLSRFKLDRDLADLYDSIRNQQAIIKSSAAFEKDFRLFQNRLQNADKLTKSQLGAVRIISLVAASTPVEVALTNFSYSEGEIKLVGIALSEIGLKSFTHSLALSPSLSEINLSSIAKQKEGDEGLKFSLTAKIKPPETK